MIEALQAALYARLSGDATLMGLITGIYDDAPQVADSGGAAAFPFVTIGDDTLGAWATDDWSGGDAICRVHAWSRYAGRKEAKAILDRIRAVLDRAQLTVTGYRAVGIDFEQAFVDVDPDGETRHGVIEFRVLLST